MSDFFIFFTRAPNNESFAKEETDISSFDPPSDVEQLKFLLEFISNPSRTKYLAISSKVVCS